MTERAGSQPRYREAEPGKGEGMLVALGQLQSGTDIAANLAGIRSTARAAAAAGAELVVFPEYAMYEKGTVDETFAGAAEPIDGQFGSAVGGLAKAIGIAIVAGMVETNPEDALRPFNTLALWNAAGALVVRHRKVHLYDVQRLRESRFISAGDPSQLSIGMLDGMCIGLQTCYELRFPEVSAALVHAGATLLVVGASWVPGPHKRKQWKTLAQARAIENQCHLIAVSQAAPISVGSSIAIAPSGTILRQLGRKPDWAVVDLPARDVHDARIADPRLLSLRAGSQRVWPKRR